jgi:hypothetical protein
MAQRYYCPDCGDFSSDREYPKTEEGYPDTPLCKSCGTECSSLTQDPRMKELNSLANKMGVARIEYKKRIDALTVLAKEVKKDWGIKQLP